MMTPNQWFDLYTESHQNSLNKLVHWVCVPLIFFSIVGLLYSIPVGTKWVNVASAVMVLSLVFYLRMSFNLFLGMALFSLACYAAAQKIDASSYNLALVSIIIFVAAWVGQFIGHKIEGKKPSFFDDLKFLLIGPAWLLHFIYKKMNIPY
jgi:uncharacterized membrane protein YGL010W